MGPSSMRTVRKSIATFRYFPPRLALETASECRTVVVTGVAVFLAFVALAFIIAGLRSDRAKRKAKKEATGTPRRGRREAEPAETVPDDEPAASADPDAEEADDHRLVGAGHRD